MLRHVVTHVASAFGTSLISLGGVIVAACISAAVAIRQSRQNGRLRADLARLDSELQTAVQTRRAMLEREMRAEEVLKRYREPLAAAAFDLGSV